MNPDAAAVAPRTAAPGSERLWLAFVFLVALALRVVYWWGADVPSPIAGDIVSYVSYTWNLVHHGTFSMALPGSAQWPPDAFRGPGYPAFLAPWLALGGDDAFPLAVGAQVVLGAATAPLAVLWARQWLPLAGAVAVGAGVAVWPHLVVFSSTLLSETVFGFVLLLLLWLVGRAAASARRRDGVLAGLAGGAATLVNPIALGLPILAAAVLAWRGRRTAAAMLLVAHFAVVGAWSVRNALHPGMPGARDRAAVNFVEGSWPLYHAAWNNQQTEPMAREVMQRITAEERLMVADPRAGLAVVVARLRADPVAHAYWYAYKPWLLWSWTVGIGWRDIYVLRTEHPPYVTQPLWRAMHATCRAINPWLFAFALVGLATVWRRRGDGVRDVAAPFAAALFLYVTSVHWLLQAEPRYSVPYRPVEFALAIATLVWAGTALHRFLRSARQRAVS